MALSTSSLSFLRSGMADTLAGNELINAIQNESVLSASAFTRLKDCLGETAAASNMQACILGTYALSPRDVNFIKDGFSLPLAELQSVLDNLAGGVQVVPAFPNFLPNEAPNAFPNGFPNSSPINVSMPAGFSFAVNFVGPAYQQWDAMTFPAGSAFASTGAGKYFELFTGANTNQYYVWYSVAGGSNTDPAPVGFTGIKVTISAADTAAQVATKTNAALSASGGGVDNYAVLGASAVTNVGNSVLTGDLGISPGTAVTGFPPGTYSGALHEADSNAADAQIAAQASFTAKETLGLAGTTIPSELGGQTLTPGAYKFASGSAGLSLTTGPGLLPLTFDGAGTYIIYTASTLTTGASGSTSPPTMALTNGALAANIYWIVGSSATINQAVESAASIFEGNVIANASITVTQDGTVNGSLIALTAAVTLSAAANVIAQSTGPSVGVLDEASSSVSGAVVTVVLGPMSAAVARPKFSVAPGIYHSTQSVSLSSGTPGATIYYTINGSQPTVLSTLYSGAISVAVSKTIKAIAIKEDLANSPVASATYVIS